MHHNPCCHNVGATGETHFKSTGSIRAREILSDWANQRARFVKVFPNEYRRALGEMAAAAARTTTSGQPA